jgi:DNA-binding LacI/PurR family transcriptional regulator
VSEPVVRTPRVAPTLEVVAALANVSRATASRVLNGSPRVSPEARESVLQAAAELNYTPNRAARSLVTKRSDSLAFVVTESEDRFFHDPFFLNMLRGAHSVLAARERQLLFVVNSGEQDRTRLINYAAGGHVDGVMLVSLHGGDSLPDRLHSLGIPVVLSGRPLDPDSTVHFVDADNRDGARAATALLINRGCRQIATIAGPRDMTAGRDRVAGYRDALRAVGERPDHKAIVDGDFSMESGFAAMRRLLKNLPDVDGIFAANDLMGIGAVQAIQSMGKRVPDDVAVVGFDDVAVAQLSTPALTTIRQPITEMGGQMAQMLVDLVDGQDVPRSVILPTELVRRASA